VTSQPCFPNDDLSNNSEKRKEKEKKKRKRKIKFKRVNHSPSAEASAKPIVNATAIQRQSNGRSTLTELLNSKPKSKATEIEKRERGMGGGE
jgi:hypothetical protein